MTQHIEPEWHYEIKYGPEGEANYAWLYRGNEMVATMKTHHAVSLSAALAAAEERGRMEERERCAQIARGLFKQEIDGTNAAFCGLLISNAITKEPPP